MNHPQSSTKATRLLAVGACLCCIGLGWLVATGCSRLRPPVQSVNPPPGDVFYELQHNVWYLPTADGKAKLYVTSLGHGPLVVFLHGGPGNDFNYFVDAVRPETDRYQFVFHDQRGSLLSPIPHEHIKDLTPALMADDLDQLRKALGKDKLLILGHSWGSVLAMTYCGRYPQHVSGMILTGCLPPNTPVGGTFADVARQLHERMRTVRNRPEVAAAWREAGLPPNPWDPAANLSPAQTSRRDSIGNAAVDLFHLDRWRQLSGGGIYYSFDVDDAVSNALESSSYDIRPVLRERGIPVEILQGDHDFADPAAAWQDAAHSGIRITVLKDAGHYAWIDAPAAFTSALDRALGRLNSTAEK
jgi:proline iminopeptidase